MYNKRKNMNMENGLKLERIEIEPLKSFNGIEFGTSREDIWKKIGKPPCGSFRKSEYEKSDTDDYKYFHIYYDENYNFEAIDIFNDIDIYCNGNKLSKKYSEILEFFKNVYDDIIEDEDGFVSIKGSIGVYLENDEDDLDVITFANKGYYDYMSE